MVLLLAFSALAISAIVATLVGLARDGYHAVPTDTARVPDRSRPSIASVPARRAYPRPVRVRGAQRVRVRAQA